MEPGRRMKASQFEQLPLRGGEIVFLGDSITEGGAWTEWYPGRPVINRGIGGDTTDGLLARIDTAVQDPSQVFLMIGTNDLALRRRPEDTSANAERIVRAIRSRAPEAALFVNSVLPRRPKYRARIEALNRRWDELASRHRATYLDLWPAFSDGRGALRSEFTLDGLHLNGDGYRTWVDLLRPHIAQR
ncbi:MAG TPA: GDSL-type esterase/lipase family protein [Microbacterium sp.]|nr:GDSL-type esterase/lipase family protein [Microbacterium sp.]